MELSLIEIILDKVIFIPVKSAEVDVGYLIGKVFITQLWMDEELINVFGRTKSPLLLTSFNRLKIIKISDVKSLMKNYERDKLINLTERAVAINEKLLANEKEFIKALADNKDITSLEDMNENLNEMCRKEYLYLSAAKSLLQIIKKDK